MMTIWCDMSISRVLFKKKAIHATPKKYILWKCTKTVDSWGFALNPNGEFTTFSKTYIAEFGWDRNVLYVFSSVLANSSIRHWGKMIFSLEKLNYTQDCTVSSMYFQFWGVAHRTLSPDPSPVQSRVSLSIRTLTSNLGRFAPLFWASPSIYPNMFDHFPKQGELDKIFHLSTSTSWLRHCVYNSIIQIVIYRWSDWSVWGPPNISDKSAPMFRYQP